jgi:DNA polymerase III subunit beta
LKITIQQSDLNKALSIVSSVVPNKTTMPALTCIKLDAEKDSLTFSATNLDTSILTTIEDVKVEKPGSVAVPANKFVSFVRSLSAGEVVLQEKSGNFTITSGKATLSESSLSGQDFPVLPQLDDKKGYEVDSSILTSMIKSTSYAVSKDETRPALMGILWEVKPTSLAMIATDAHRLAKIERKMDWGITDISNVITDTQGLHHFVRLADESDKTVVYFGNKQLSFVMERTVIHTREHEGPFPDYTAVIPQTNNLLVNIDREAFVNTVKRVSITADRITNQIRLGIEKDRLELSAKGTDGSRAEDELPAAYDGEALEIGFNYNYLLDVLKNISTETIQLAVKDSNSAALISPVDAEEKPADLLCLLMPLRLTSE